MCNDQLEEIESKDCIIKVDFEITNSNFHEITNEISINKGVGINAFFDDFKNVLEKSSHIISHNLDFDINVIKNELYRNDKKDIIKEIERKKLICSMKEMKKIMKTSKWPSLTELYKFATKNDITNQHNSKDDVIHLHQALKQLHDNNIYKVKDFAKCKKIESVKEPITDAKELEKLKVPELKNKCKECGLSGLQQQAQNRIILYKIIHFYKELLALFLYFLIPFNLALNTLIILTKSLVNSS